MSRPLCLIFCFVCACAVGAAQLRPVTAIEHVQNGGFEREAGDGAPNAWRPRSAPPDGVQLARLTDSAHTGKYCAAILSTYAEDRPWSWWEQRVPVREGDRYQLSLWLRTEELTRGGVLLMSFLSEDGKDVQRRSLAGIETGTKAWTRYAVEFQAPSGTTSGRLQVSIHGAGRLWFDDVSLTSVLRPRTIPVASSLVYPVFQRGGIVVDGQVDDWDGVARARVSAAYQVSHAEAIVMDQETSSGSADLSFEFALSSSDTALHLLIVVRDDVFATRKPYWQGDSIQLGLDTAYDRSPNGYGAHDVAIGVHPGEGDNVAAVVERNVGGVAMSANDLSVAFARSHGGYVVELAIPWTGLGCAVPLHNQRMGFSMIVNDSDGAGRKWAQWASGIATGKRPAGYGTALFLRRNDVGLFLEQPTRRLTDLHPVELAAIVIAPDVRTQDLPLTLRVSGTDLADARTVPVRSGITRVPLVYDGGSVPAGRQTLEIASGGITSATTIDVLPLRGTVAHVESGLVQINAKMADLRSRIARARKAGLDVAQHDATLAVAEHFCRWIPADLARNGDEDLAAQEMDRLEPLVDKALSEIKQVSASPGRHPAVPRPDALRAVMRDGGWYIDDRPMLLIGLNQFDRAYWPDLLRLGGNFDTTGGGAAAHVMRGGPEPDMEAVETGTVANVRAAAALGIRSDIHFGHRMPAWTIEKHPDITAAEGHFMFYDIDSPEARMLTCQTIEAIAGALRDVPGVTCYDLWNEAAYSRMSKRGLASFRQAMREQYGVVDRLNAEWGTTFADFEQVRPVTRDAAQPAAYADWVGWNNARFAGYIAEMQQAVRRGHPDALTTVKFSNEAALVGTLNHAYRTQSTSRHNMGVSRYAMAQLLDIQGCDTRPTLLSPDYAFAWRYPGMAYDLQRSFAPDKPIDDSEWHGIQTVYYENVDQPAKFLDAALWFSYLHGMDMNLTWWWSRNGTEPKPQWFRGSLLTQPQLLDAWARNSITVQRFAAEIVAFQDSRARVRLLFSEPSAILDLVYLDTQRDLYEGLNWFGLDIGFLGEEMLLNGFREMDVLFVAGARHCSPGVREAIAKLADNGVTVVMVGGQCLTLDPHGEALLDVPAIRGPAPVAATDSAAIEAVLADAGATRPVRCIGPDGRTSKPVEFRTVAAGDRTLGYLIGLGLEPCGITITVNGKPATCRSLLTGTVCEGTRTVAPYDVDLFEVALD